MKIIENTIFGYVERIWANEPFSFAGYSDAEWLCVLGQRLGVRTGLGQIIDADHGKLLADILRRRQHDARFLFAIPKCLWQLPCFADAGGIDDYLKTNGIDIVGYERDLVTDELAMNAGLYPLISTVRRFRPIIIGPGPLRGIDFLNYSHFVEISTPNLHLEIGGIERAVEAASRCETEQRRIFLVSAGVSAAVIIDRLHDLEPKSFLIDCGSIWDAFVGIGGQRPWRARLYDNPDLLAEWKRLNFIDHPIRRWESSVAI